MRVPASKRMMDALNQRAIELQLFSRNHHHDFRVSVRREGDTFANSFDPGFLMLVVKTAIEGNLTAERESELNTAMEMLYDDMTLRGSLTASLE